MFPNLFSGFLSESLLARAHKKKLLKITTHDLRKWTNDNHKTVDDRPYGGGAGMVLKIEPIYKAVQSLKSKIKNQKSKFRSRTILLSAKGKTFTQKDARRLAKYDQIILICGRYEGVDERVAKYVADEEISIGNYVLSGGEIAAMVLVDSVSRLVKGVIKNEEFNTDESFSDPTDRSKLDFPQYTKPRDFKGLKVPDVLLSGNHKEIEKWRNSKR